MAESSLSLTYQDLIKAVGFYLGFGYPKTGTTAWNGGDTDDIDNWNSDKFTQVNDIVQSGVRQFYNPPSIPGETTPYKWRFLEPVSSFDTASDDYDVDLPDNFGILVGDLTFTDTSRFPSIKNINEVMIRRSRQTDSNSGRPQFCAVRPKSSDGNTGQRYELILWPTPDAVYAIEYKYAVLMNVLDVTNKFHFGGATHSETVKASCLAVAEKSANNENHVCKMEFQERLAVSVAHDRRVGPDYFGYNSDASDGSSRRDVRSRENRTVSIVTSSGTF